MVPAFHVTSASRTVGLVGPRSALIHWPEPCAVQWVLVSPSMAALAGVPALALLASTDRTGIGVSVVGSMRNRSIASSR